MRERFSLGLQMLCGRRALVAAGVLALGLAVLGSKARADGVCCLWPNPVPPFTTYTTFFPNWKAAPAASFFIWEYMDDAVWGNTDIPIVGLTMLNYGTAVAGTDIENMYFRILCGNTDSTLVAMTYAGDWTIGGFSRPAWTWAGSIPWATDPCAAATKGCDCLVDLQVYVDIGPCPTVAATIKLGPGYREDQLYNADGTLACTWGVDCPFGLTDSWGYGAPWWEAQFDTKTIQYIMKSADRTTVVPGDTISYTIYYGTPGTGILTDLWVIDTKPGRTKLLPGGTPPPAVDIDRLLWSFSGSIDPSSGATSEITFSVSVNWGNCPPPPLICIESESGNSDINDDVNGPAVEGAFLFNNAHLSWAPQGGCASAVSNTHATVVRRYMFWKLANQDILFAPRIGFPDDEIVYELFVRNLSSTKTWWDVVLWDTVPVYLDSWLPGMGIYDPCVGWTMTPSGCAAANAGKLLTGAKGETTLLTWKIDMPPGMTLTVKWQAKMRTSGVVAVPGDTAINEASIMALGRPGIIGGTGGAKDPRLFTHFAKIILHTTFVSYVGFADSDDQWFSACNSDTNMFYISFFPLNTAATIAMWRKWCNQGNGFPGEPNEFRGGAGGCDLFAANGGVSPPIDRFAGTCAMGLTGACGDCKNSWECGCKVARAPARYVPWEVNTACGGVLHVPHKANYLHKILTNAPTLWEFSTCLEGDGDDANAFIGTTDLSFRGYIGYTTMRWAQEKTDSLRRKDSLHIINTDDTRPTSVFVFEWDMGSEQWNFITTRDIYDGSQWAFDPTPANGDWAHYRIVSSATQLIMHKAYIGLGIGGANNDWGTLAPNRESGGLVSMGDGATFYLIASAYSQCKDVAIVGTMGAKAEYDIWKYLPFDSNAPNPNARNISADLVGSAGRWVVKALGHTVDAAVIPPVSGGLVNTQTSNAHIYGSGFDQSVFAGAGGKDALGLYKVILKSGGPIQTYCGCSIIDRYSGGAVLHAYDAAALAEGSFTGQEYWLHGYVSDHLCSKTEMVEVFNVFTPKVNLGFNLNTSNGFSATYTTDDRDQCIAFNAIVPKNKNNVQGIVQPGGNPGAVIAQYIECNEVEKMYTAPFLEMGVFYEILAPPVVFSGQTFWVTVQVIEAKVIKTDYTGTATFTSTDSNASLPLDYTYTSTDAGTKIFYAVTLTTLGLQSIVATDTIDGSIAGLTTVMVVATDVKLLKEPKFSVQASGDTVTFRICWSNYSSASAFTFTINDAIPEGTGYEPNPASDAFMCGPPTNPVTYSMAYSTTVSSTIPPKASWTDIGGATSGTSPPTNTTWLRWTIDVIGVYTTGCVCYRVTID